MSNDIRAECPKCGNTEFKSTAGANPQPNDQFICARCGRVVLYRDLIARMGKKAENHVADELRKRLKTIKLKL